MKESRLQANIIQWLNALPETKAINPHGNQYTESGTPDILCVRNGRVYFFEVKTPAGRVSRIQEHRIAQWRTAGATAQVVRSLKEVKEILGEQSSEDE